MRQDKDRVSKWLIGHFGDAILSLGGFPNARSWQAVQAELVAPRRLPDGLIEAKFGDQAEPELFLIEIETYPNRDMDRQVSDDLLMVAIERGIMPEVIALVLRPKGNIRPEGKFERASRRKSALLHAAWRVVELWNLQADDLFSTGEVGLVPWIPLSQTTRSPEALLKECRLRIDRDAKPSDISALLAATQVFTELAFPKSGLIEIFGGSKAMIESPYLDEIIKLRLQMVADRTTCQTLRSAIVGILEARFGRCTNDPTKKLEAVTDEARLRQLLRQSATCASEAAFFEHLQ